MSDRRLIVTIDGPSGAGKSTISRQLASELGYTYLDTGAMYRAVGLKVLRQHLDLDTEAGGKQLATLLEGLEITLAPAATAADETRVFLDGVEVSAEIRTAAMGLVASRVSAEPLVRAKLTDMQRRLAGQGGVVAEGRDTGTVVFPGAECKFYLDATPDERARRRCLQLQHKGQAVDYADILAQIIKRDQNDSGRDLAPLRPAPDAMVIDSTAVTADEVVGRMAALVRARQSARISPA